jgi:hypothetical protein
MRRGTPALVLTLALAAGLLAAGIAVPGALVAQDAGAAAIPRPASGTSALVLPLQDVEPLPSGRWPGGAAARSAVLERFGAEIDFAVEAGDRGPDWVGPRELRAVARRNPMLGVDPDRLAAGGLPAVGGDLPGALHGQLRELAAATGARFALLPLRLAYRRQGPPASACRTGEGERAGSEARSGLEAGEDTSAARAGDDRIDDRGDARGRAVLCVAMLDVRGARVLWRGAVVGPPRSPDDPSLLATLAQRLLVTFSGGS